MHTLPNLSLKTGLLWLVGIVFLVGVIDESFARRWGGGGFRSYGGYRAAPPRPMVPRYNQGPRYRAPAQLAPKSTIPRTTSPGFSNRSVGASVRSLPPKINPNSSVAKMPSYMGRVTKAGSPIINGKSGKPFSIPQQGVFSTRMSLMSGASRTALMAKVPAATRGQLKQRLADVASGAKVATTKVAGGGGSGSGNSSGAGSGGPGKKGIKGEFNKAALSIDKKISGQFAARGWTEKEVRDITNTRPIGKTTDQRAANKTLDKTKRNDPASVYGSKNGYIIVNDRTKEVVQISNKKNPELWVSDSRIKWED